MKKLADLRQEYQKHVLSEENVFDDPYKQFHLWFNEALNVEVHEPNAFTFATVDREGCPTARILLLKGFDEEGFVFYTNYKSNKAKELEENPRAAMVFLWHELERQVRIKGIVEKVSRAESEEYFHSRPRESQMGAWVSPQSLVIPSRSILDSKMQEVMERFKEVEKIPIPENWGGYRLRPKEIEFWQGRPNRLHDRLKFSSTGEKWNLERLAP